MGLGRRDITLLPCSIGGVVPTLMFWVLIFAHYAISLMQIKKEI